MVEPLFFTELPQEISPGETLSLSGSEGRHAVTVRRILVGEYIALADGSGRKVRGQVLATGKDTLSMRVVEIIPTLTKALRITLVQALAKADRDELAIQAATELGIEGVIPWQADRSVSIWKDEKKAKGQIRWQQIVSEAAKQSLRPLIPMVHGVLNSKELTEKLATFDSVLILEPTSEKPIAEAALSPGQSIAVVIGPEGGISEQELVNFANQGYELVRTGSGILRTSTAAIATIAYLNAQLGGWQ